MDNNGKLKKVFAESLQLSAETVNDDIRYGSEKWDSIAHMALVAAIETEFDIMLASEDVIDMSSFKKAKEILNKYEIRF